MSTQRVLYRFSRLVSTVGRHLSRLILRRISTGLAELPWMPFASPVIHEVAIHFLGLEGLNKPIV